jgi:hypothetical protein
VPSYLYEICHEWKTLATGRFPSEGPYRIGDLIRLNGYVGEIVDLIPLQPDTKLIVEVDAQREDERAELDADTL